MTIPSKKVIIAVTLSMVMVMTAGCAGWGADGPAEPQSEEDGTDGGEAQAQDETSDGEDSSATSSSSSKNGESSTDEGSDGDEMSSTASEAESDSASDADSGSESTTNVDSDSKSETNANPDSEAGATSEANQDSESESNVKAEGGSADVDIDIDNPSSTTVEADSESNSDSDSTSVADSDSDSDSTSLSSSDSQADSDSDSEASSDSVSSSDGGEDESTDESGTTGDDASSQSSTNDAVDGSDESENNTGSDDPSSDASQDDSDETEGDYETHTLTVHAGEPEPVENVDVTIKRHEDGAETTKTTGEDGTVTFDVYEGTYTVTGVDERREDQAKRVEVTGDTEVTLDRLERPLGDIQGSYMDVEDQNGDAVSDIGIKATTEIPGGETHVMEAEDGNGALYPEGHLGETYTIQEVYDTETGETYPVTGVVVGGQKEPKEFVHTKDATAVVEIEHPGSFPEESNETAAA